MDKGPGLVPRPGVTLSYVCDRRCLSERAVRNDRLFREFPIFHGWKLNFHARKRKVSGREGAGGVFVDFSTGSPRKIRRDHQVTRRDVRPRGIPYLYSRLVILSILPEIPRFKVHFGANHGNNAAPPPNGGGWKKNNKLNHRRVLREKTTDNTCLP